MSCSLYCEKEFIRKNLESHNDVKHDMTESLCITSMQYLEIFLLCSVKYVWKILLEVQHAQLLLQSQSMVKSFVKICTEVNDGGLKLAELSHKINKLPIYILIE